MPKAAKRTRIFVFGIPDAGGAETLDNMLIWGAEGAGTFENNSKVRLTNDEAPQAKLVS